MQENIEVNTLSASNPMGKPTSKKGLPNLKISRGQAELVMNQLSPLLKPYDATVSVAIDHFGRGYSVIVFCPSDNEPEVSEIVAHVNNNVPVEILPTVEAF